MGVIYQFLSRLGPADLSSLVVLRVLVTHVGEQGRLIRAELLRGMQNEYERLSRLPGFGPVGAGMPDIALRPEEETLRYLDEHVLQRFFVEGILEPPRDPEADPGVEPEMQDWSVLRLTPAATAEMAELQNRNAVPELVAEIDRYIEQILREPFVSAAQTAAQHASASTNGGSTLAAKGLVKSYRKRRVVNDVDLQVSQGEIVGLLGPNGAGKTTTFYMMVGLIEPDRGRVFLSRDDLTGTPMYRRARRGIGYLAQEPSVFRKLTVEENILAVLQMIGISRRKQRERLELLLDELGIKHLRSTKAYALSGGERRRLEITRALVGNPKFMLLDEPFAGVDPIAVHDIQQIVADLRRRGIGVLISDHNVEQTLDIVDRAYIMYDGRVRVSGTVSELVWNDEVAEIYLGPTLTARMRQRYTQPEGGAGE